MIRPRRHSPQAPSAGPRGAVVIRPSRPADEAALARLAELDGDGASPAAESLIAEVESEVLAAVALDGGAVIADPFRPTAALVEMLQLRAAQLAGVPARRGLRSRISDLLLSRRGRPATAPATPGNEPLFVSRD